MTEVVDPFDNEASASGEPMADPFDAPPPDFSKVGEFEAEHASEGQKWRIALGYLTTPDARARADIIRKVLPGATVQDDPNNGRPVISYKGETGYIDKPGVTLGGILDSIAQVGKFIPAGKFAAGGANILTQVGRAGLAGAATSVAEDAGAMAQGSEQGINPEKAAIATVASAAGQALSKPIGAGLGWLTDKGQQAWKLIRRNPMAVRGDGTLTPLGRRWAASAGLDPDQITPQLVRELEGAAEQATKAGAGGNKQAVAKQALANRFKVPLTKGELTGDYEQQSLEEGLKRMDVSTKAGRLMREHEQQAAAAMRGESGESGFGLLRREVGKPATDVSDAGHQVLDATKNVAAADKAAYRAQYTTAREAGAELDPRAYTRFLDDAEANLKTAIEYDKELYPQTEKVLKVLRSRADEAASPEGWKNIPLARLENLRRLINDEWKSANSTERRALDVLRNQFDEMVNGAIDSGRVVGNQAAVKAWRAGRDLFSRFQKLYAPNPRAGQAEQRAGRTVENWLKSDEVTGEQVIREAVTNKALTSRIISINGVDSPAHVALKQGALEFVFRPALKNDTISPRAIVTQFERYFKGQNSEQMRAIFSPKDIKAIREFVELAKSKIPLRGVENFSNSGNVLAKTMQQLGSRLGLIASVGNFETAAALGAMNAASGMRATSQAKEAVRGLVPTNRIAAPSVAIAGGGSHEIDE